MKKPNIGDNLYLVRYARRGDVADCRHVTVTRVGRKFFYVGTANTPELDIAFRLSDWSEQTEYVTYYKLYESVEKYREEIEAEELRSKISKACDWTCIRMLTLGQLRGINQILAGSP